MPQSGSPSYLANMAQRRRALIRVRSALLDRPGIQPPNPTAPPATVPAQGKTSPQEQALARRQQLPVKAQEPTEGQVLPPEGGEQPRLFDEDTRERLKEQVRPFLAEIQRQKLAQLHRRVGRVRRFWGSGV